MDKRCPLKLKAYPTCACPEGKRAIDAAKQGLVGGCEWFVASHEANYCWFKFIRDEARPVEPKKIAQLLMIDDAEVKRIIQGFRRKIPQLLD